MPWINLHRLLINLRQRRIQLRDVTVYVDDELLDPGYRRQLWGHSTPEEDEPLFDEDEKVEGD